jgi:PAS domain S-box-containing protein
VGVTGSEKSAYDDLPDGLVVADADRRVVALNPAAERLLGTSADAALGRDFREVLPLTDSQGRDWWQCTDPYGGLRSRRRQPECQLTLAGGAELLVTASYVRGPDRELTRLVVALRDTHARERLERSRADLVSTVAHELRSPLTSVKGFTATLLAKWDRFNDEQKKVMLQTVNADADRVTRLITELLDVSRIDLQVHGELPEMWVDPDKFQQVVGNLVENALRHGEGVVTVTVGPSTVDGGPGAVVTVSDEGEGIPETVVSRVFTRFWRGGDRRGGTGLGLYIVKGLVEAHGGTVSVGPGPAGGAEFRLVLPAGTPDFL